MLKTFLVFISVVTFVNGMNNVVPISRAYSETFNNCSKEVISTYDITVCLEKELKLQDKKLNQAYKKTMSRIQNFRKEDLKNIQRAWMKYRDLKCGFYYHSESGRSGLSDMSECFLDETILRTIELEHTF